MGEYDFEQNQVFYEHDATCSGKEFTDLNERGLKTCLECAGVFDSTGKGVQVDSPRFDENYVLPPES